MDRFLHSPKSALQGVSAWCRAWSTESQGSTCHVWAEVSWVACGLTPVQNIQGAVLIHPLPDTWETLEKQPDASSQSCIVLVTVLGILWLGTGLQALAGQSPPPHKHTGLAWACCGHAAVKHCSDGSWRSFMSKTWAVHLSLRKNPERFSTALYFEI
jgi:hypothetical protein